MACILRFVFLSQKTASIFLYSNEWQVLYWRLSGF